MAYANLLRTAKELRYSGIMWQNWFKGFGCTSSDHTLCKMKASKRLRSDQPRNEQSHKRALSIINTE